MRIDLKKQKVLKKIEINKLKIVSLGVKKIGLFGSVLKGSQNKKSDIDILVEFQSISFDKYTELLFLLEKMFKRKIDLIVESSLRPELNYVKEEAEYVRL